MGGGGGKGKRGKKGGFFLVMGFVTGLGVSCVRERELCVYMKMYVIRNAKRFG